VSLIASFVSEKHLEGVDWKAPIGKGASGIVYKGLYKKTPDSSGVVIAIKKPFDDSLFEESMKVTHLLPNPPAIISSSHQ